MHMDESIVNSAEAAQTVEESTALAAVTLSGVTSSGIASPAAREIAYTIKDVNFQPLNVYASANAWWMDRRKVERLIEAFKAGHMVKDSCFYAGISEAQWKYFNEIHPEFSPVREACESYQRFAAMDSVNKAIPADPRLALQYLKLRHEGFRSTLKVESETPLAPTVNVAVSTDVDTTKIKDVLKGVVADFLAERSRARSDAQGGGGAVAGGD